MEVLGYTSGNPEGADMKEALAKYAKALCDSLFVSEWDGFDIDWEPTGGFNDADNTLTYRGYNGYSNMEFLIKEMGNYIGPKSDPEERDINYWLLMDISIILVLSLMNI